MDRKLKNKKLIFGAILGLLVFASLSFAAWQKGDKFNVGDVRIDSDGYLYGTNATFTGDVDVSSGEITLYSRTEAQLKALSPTTVGAIYYDSTNKAIIIATGTAAGNFAIAYDGSTMPTGW